MSGEVRDGDHRSEFERDYDRIIFSSPVRRLQDKTQVFPLDPNDSVRTRLTHSLEVSSVARGLAKLITSKLPDSYGYSKDCDQFIQTIAATAGLVHDLGNPPFGHFGESAVSSWFKTPTGLEALKPIANAKHLAADLTKFEGNARGIRILGNLQVLADRTGLNVTAATLASCMKYVAPSHEADKDHEDHAKSKPGYCQTERHLVEKVWDATGTDGSRHPITFIVEAADDCVYAFCDLEDGVKKGVIDSEDLFELLDVAGLDDLATEARDLIPSQLAQSKLELNNRSRDEASAVVFRVKAQGIAIRFAADQFISNYDDIMAGTFKGELLPEDPKSDEAVPRLMSLAKTLGRKKVYRTRSNIELELRGQHIIHDLLNLLWPGAFAYQGEDISPKKYEGKAWSLLSQNFRNVFIHDYANSADAAEGESIDNWRHYLKLMLLTDHICGMTDGYASQLHKSLFNG
jgi:dGTPase